MNPNCWGGDHAAIHVEKQVIGWLAAAIGLPPDAEGILVSGGSMANFTALAAARRATTPGNVREDGLAGPDRPRLTVYASDQVHACVDKAVDLLGIGTAQLRKLPSDERFRVRPGRSSRARSRRTGAAGFTPSIVVGNAGTVNTGAIDPLDELADLCAREGLWFHVDGAYGAHGDALARGSRPLFAGIERADSVAADPHKWLYVPYEAGATLVREPGRLGATFRKFPEYLASDAESPFPGPAWFAERGVELSRGLQGVEGLDGMEDARHPRVRAGDRERRPPRALPLRRRSTGGPISNGSPRPSSRSRTSATRPRDRDASGARRSTRSTGGS